MTSHNPHVNALADRLMRDIDSPLFDQAIALISGSGGAQSLALAAKPLSPTQSLKSLAAERNATRLELSEAMCQTPEYKQRARLLALAGIDSADRMFDAKIAQVIDLQIAGSAHPANQHNYLATEAALRKVCTREVGGRIEFDAKTFRAAMEQWCHRVGFPLPAHVSI